MVKFFFFGCWNRDACNSKEIDYRGTILQNLSKKQNLFDFGIIAGDNVYPLKMKKEGSKDKAYYEQTLLKGVNQLKTSSPKKRKHVILGNHNAAVKVTNKERDLFIENDLFKLYTDIASVTTYSDENTGKIMCDFIFLNTNTFTPDNMDNVIIELGKAFGVCQTNDIFIVGHDPLIAAKVKKGESFVYIHGLERILDVLFNHITGDGGKEKKKLTYLCADVHNFQALTVSHTIGNKTYTLPIIVAGTGGADPDLDIFETSAEYKGGYIDTTTLYRKKYNVKVHVKDKPYGFCIINSNNKKTITYHKVIDCDENDIVLDKTKNKNDGGITNVSDYRVRSVYTKPNQKQIVKGSECDFVEYDQPLYIKTKDK